MYLCIYVFIMYYYDCREGRPGRRLGVLRQVRGRAR